MTIWKFTIISIAFCSIQMIGSINVQNLHKNYVERIQIMVFDDKGLQADSTDVNMGSVLLNSDKYTFQGPMMLSCSIFHPLLDEV